MSIRLIELIHTHILTHKLDKSLLEKKKIFKIKNFRENIQLKIFKLAIFLSRRNIWYHAVHHYKAMILRILNIFLNVP